MIQKALGVLILLFVSSVCAQKTAVFNGKTYLVYPQEIDNYHGRTSPYLYMDWNVSVGAVSFPPIIGSMPDGEYLIYSNNYNYIKKGGRGRHTIYDTVQVVYGTFTIKANQKQGSALVYGRYNQSRIDCRLHYENDLLEGRFRIDVSDHEDFDNSSDYTTYPYKGRVVKEDLFAEVMFSKGLLVDKIALYFVTNGKDTMLSKVLEVKNGIRHGKYDVYFYVKEKKKIRVYSTIKGTFTEGLRDGHWENRVGSRLIDLKIFNAGRMTYKKNNWYYADTNTFLIQSFGKDSVLKYFPDYKHEKTKYYSDNYSSIDHSDSFSVIQYKYGKESRRAFRAYGLVSIDYGNDYDTTINGHVFRVDDGFARCGKKWCREKEYCIIDSTLTDEYNYRRQVIYTELFDQNSNQFVKARYNDAYYRYFFKDSLRPEKIDEKKFKRYTESEFYQRALDYKYTNYKYNKGKAKNCSVYYAVSGGANNGSVIKYIKIPSHYDTIYLVDTLMANGKFLYAYDEYFDYGYKSLIKDYSRYENDGMRKNIVADEIYDFMEAGPVQHQTLMLGNSRYKGKLSLEVRYTDKPQKVKAQVFEYRENILDIFEKRLSIEIVVDRRKGGLMASTKTNFVIPSGHRFQKYENGLLNGNVVFTDIKNQISFESFYADNKLTYFTHVTANRFKTDHAEYEYDEDGGYDFLKASSHRRYYSYKKAITKDNTYIVNGSLMQYDKGVRNGQWMMYSNGQLYQTYNFHNGKQNGQQLTFNTGERHTLNYVYTMQNDTVNGKVYELFSDGLPERTGTYHMGIPHGYFTNYNQYSDTALYYKQRFQFNHGYLIGNYIEYRDSDNLKMKITFHQADSISYTELDGYGYRKYFNDGAGETDRIVTYNFKQNMSGYEFMGNIFRQKQFRKGYYQYYYSSGYLFKQGNKEYDQPVGHWEVYREGENRLYKTIDFRDSLFFPNTPDSLYTFGLVKAYYDNGQMMFTGLATDYGFKYSCESETDMPTESDYYLNFYDTLGKPVLVNGSGFISELQANGNKLKEGKIVNNKKEGIWIYYSKFGLPEEIGVYKDGKKTGRWLSGDLGGLNLDEKICFMSDEEFRGWVSAFGGNLNLQEEYYENGELLNTNSVNTIKR